jgi:hypothetical protein
VLCALARVNFCSCFHIANRGECIFFNQQPGLQYISAALPGAVRCQGFPSVPFC